jgi:hypothetical protein
MKQMAYALVGWLLLLTLASCGAARRNPDCATGHDTAVVVYLSDEQQQPLDGVTLGYQYNNGTWQQLDEPIDGETSLGHQAGRYRLRADKEGYAPAEMVVVVSRSSAGGCRLQTEQANLQLARTCGQPEDELEFAASFAGLGMTAVDGRAWAAGDLELSYRFAGGDWQTAACRAAVDREAFRCTLRAEGQALPAAASFLGHRPGYPYVAVEQTLDRNAHGCLYLAGPLHLAGSESCSDVYRALRFDLASTAVELPAGLSVTALKPGSAQAQAVHCQAGAANEWRCALDLNVHGAYQVNVEGLPNAAELLVDEGLVAYQYDGYEMGLSHGRGGRSFRGTGAGSLAVAFEVAADEAGCPFVDLDQVSSAASQFGPFANPALPQAVDLRLQHGLTMTGPNDAACPAETVITPIAFKLLLPPGTPLAETAVAYRYGELDWQPGECNVHGADFLCTTLLPNPLRAQPLVVKATVQGTDYIGLQIPAGSNLCLVFR